MSNTRVFGSQSANLFSNGVVTAKDESWEELGYWSGFNGQEKDDEVKGAGNTMDYKFRSYDARIGRFFAVDPLSKDYAWNSCYAFAENDVIRCIDLEGAERLNIIMRGSQFARIEVLSADAVEGTLYGFQINLLKISEDGNDVSLESLQQFTPEFAASLQTYLNSNVQFASNNTAPPITVSNSREFANNFSTVGPTSGFKVSKEEVLPLIYGPAAQSTPLTLTPPSSETTVENEAANRYWFYQYPSVILNRFGKPRRIGTFNSDTGVYYDYSNTTNKGKPLIFNLNGDIMSNANTIAYPKPTYPLNTAFPPSVQDSANNTSDTPMTEADRPIVETNTPIR